MSRLRENKVGGADSGFSLLAVATLGIGIGASTATFSIAEAVLMRPLPVHEQRNLVVLWGGIE